MTKSSRDLEILAAEIQKQLAPGAEVLHDLQLDGRQSKRKRQIDVLVRDKIGQYEIQIIIECKDYAKPIDIKSVEEFYGLLCDVGAQKGVLICPKGFSHAAKTRAEGLQIALYSPVDTNPHKWQAKVTIPSICDFRSAAISVGMTMTAPLPLKIHNDFHNTKMVYDEHKAELGITLDAALRKWNDGQFPVDVGEHQNLSIFDSATLIENGYGSFVPVHLSASLWVSRQLYFGTFPVERMSGFKDEFSGKVITNAFTLKIINPEDVEAQWLKIDSEDAAPVKPFINLIGLVGWGID
jgi:hypothetical protein